MKGLSAASNPDQTQSVGRIAELRDKLNELPMVRPDKIDAVKQVLQDGKYPPDQLLNRIAGLLAIHFD
jgi:hypothetical protein